MKHGGIYFKKGELKKAIIEFKSVLKKNPDHVNAVYNLGQVYYHEGLTGRMKKDYEDFVKSSKDAASILFSISKSMISVAAADKGDATKDTSIIGKSQAMTRIQDLIKRAAASDATVLVLGENGTGKELVARSIHLQSGRHDKPFVPIACSALSESFLESEFSDMKGVTFTGAVGQKIGKLKATNQGTVFWMRSGKFPSLPESNCQSPPKREFERVGGTQNIKVDIRVIAATNWD